MQQQIVWEGDTAYGHYQVVDALYDGRPARVLYSGDRQATQSGVATDDKPELLFDYNQRLFELISGVSPARLLLIGGAVLTLPKALLQQLPRLRIDVVEPDAALTELAHKFFGVPVDERLAVFNTDGRSFLSEHAGRYDMVVIDAFTHTAIPADLKTVEFFTGVYKHLAPHGVVAMNVISGYHGTGTHVLSQVYTAALHPFDTVDIFLASRGYSLWLPQNFVVVGQKGAAHRFQDYTRGDLVQPPEVNPGQALHDNG